MMIKPYATVLSSFASRFSEIGFAMSNDADFTMTFSNGSYSIEISTEKYYHPSITTRFLDASGGKFSMRLVREILSPEQLIKDSKDLNAIKLHYHLDEPVVDIDMQEKGVIAFVSLAMEQLLDFLSSHKDELFAMNDSFKTEYATREKALLKNFGLEVGK
ncbi:MAG TPA: hypothetical protein VMV48_02615 [Gallionellaceae bacterium]|nr:hypothetical protein [Gallionellaceae bacterium]